MTPRVSVVVPAYQNAAYVAATVESVLAQTYPDFELVVADHSSTDETWSVLQRYREEPRVRLLRTPAGGGAVRNWNRVTREARGELVKLVCGDDLLRPQALEQQVVALDSAGPAAVLVCGRRDLIDGRGAVFVRRHGLGGLSARMRGPEAVRAIVRSGGNPLGEPAAVLLRRDALDAAGGWNAEVPFYLDAGTYARVLRQGDLVALDETVAAFRVSASQWSFRLAREQHLEAARFHAQMRELFPDDVRPGDVRLGNARARGAALKRRLAYVWLGRRMHAAPPTDLSA